MFDFGPPFQIDANLGGPAGITEMLVQSTDNEISVLPALPGQWLNGSLTGVRLRDGGKLDIAWKEGRLIEVKLQSEHAMKYRVLYSDRSTEVQIEPRKPMVLDGALHAVGM